MFLEIKNLVQALFATGALGHESVLDNLVAYFSALEDEDYRDCGLGNLGVKCILLGNVQRGCSLVAAVSKNHERCMFFCDAAEKIPASPGLARDLLKSALAASLQMGAGWERAECLNRVALVHRLIGDEKDALSVWDMAIEAALAGQESDNRQDSLDASSVLADIAVNLSRASRSNRAIEAARRIKNEHKRNEVLSSLSAS